MVDELGIELGVPLFLVQRLLQQLADLLMQDFFSGGGLALIDIFPQLAVGEGESPGPLALVLLQDVPVLQLLQQGRGPGSRPGR